MSRPIPRQETVLITDPGLNIALARDKVSPEEWAVRGELIPVPKEIIESAYGQVMASGRAGQRRGWLVWPGLLRRLDHLDPSYRT